jgi:outer membrane receptor protein involved in Fe transport
MRTALVILFLAMFFRTNAQVVTGKISSDTGEPLPGAIAVADDTIASTADENGNYKLRLSAGEHKLLFRLISFEPKSQVVNLNSGDSISLNVQLGANKNVLAVVVVSAGKFEQRLEDVTVSMEVLKPNLIESRNSVIMDEAIDYIPGVVVIDGQANIRGGSGWSYGAGSRVQILVDDLPQLTADANDAKWNFIPVENLEQVEVIKGASSVLFGSSALNGVMNIRTAYPRDTPTTKVTLFGGMYDNASITTDKKYQVSYQQDPTYYGGASFLHSQKIKRFDLVIGGNYFNDQSYRQDEYEKRGRINVNTRYNFKLKGLSAGVNFNTMVNNENVFFLWQNDTTGAYKPAISMAGVNTISTTKAYRTNIDPFITYINDKGSLHKLRTRWFGTNNINNTDQDSKSDLYYLEYQYQKRFSNLVTLTAGIVDITSKVGSELYGDHTGRQNAGYVQGDVKWNRFTFSGGVRAERNKVDTILDKLTPVFRAGVNYNLGELTYFRLSAGQGYRFPSIAERFIKTTVGGANIFPNPDLIPEKGQSYEFGVKQLFGNKNLKGYVDLAIFQNDYQNMIEFAFAQWGTTGTFDDLGFKSYNVGNTRIRGYEISMLAEIKLPREITMIVQGGYTYLDPRQLTYDSLYVTLVGEANALGSDSTNFLKYRFKHMVRGDVEIKRKNISLGSSIRYTSRMENIDRIFTAPGLNVLDVLFPPGLGIADYRKHFPNGDVIIDFRIGYDFNKHFTLTGVVKNAFNHIYMQRPGDMQAPRVFALQAVATF